MKYLVLILSTVILAACNSKKSALELKTEVIKRLPAKEANAEKNDRGYLIGIANKEMFQDPSYKGWYNSRYSEYNVDEETITKLKPVINNYTIKGFMGTWCGDSKRNVPRFYKILEEAGFDENYFELVTVGRNKKTPDNLQEGFDLLRVPTFIFYKNGKEVGRFVERPRETIEKDILKIVTGEPYKHSYDKSE
ncbi:thioredoxin family protein [Polaribacter porphyrae]|uniref:Thiol reductase thioredoxin n=1 Tax=Polaribacter porphyrae TaxID=1137780 RepID=A0A2S7WQU2_9FLAO|nr:thioredoxin family protein [Polaribacter porphyrae]PQJ79631.1 thiol reductase thioredoxin [Polaribacter porphyrae]